MQRESLTSAGPEPIFYEESQGTRLSNWLIAHKFLTAAALLIALGTLTIIILYFASVSSPRPVVPTTQAGYGYLGLLPRLGEATIVRPHAAMPQENSRGTAKSTPQTKRQRGSGGVSAAYVSAVQSGVASFAQSVSRLNDAIEQSSQTTANKNPINVVTETVTANVAIDPVIGQIKKVTPASLPPRAPSLPAAAKSKVDFSVPLQHGLGKIQARASNALPLR
jgi:hypothetical protein